MLSAKGQVLTKFSEEDDDSLYLRDVVRLIATERRQKRLGAISDKYNDTMILQLNITNDDTVDAGASF